MANIVGTNGNDTLFGSPTADIINYADGGLGNDVVYAYGGNDVLYGGAGNDTLIGGAGNDTMYGGIGDDTYYVDGEDNPNNISDVGGGGFDTVISTVNWTLGNGFEKLQVGVGNLNGTGNSLNNVLYGGAGDNILDGGSGNDTINGYEGNDTLIGGSGNDVLNGGTGTDSMTGVKNRTSNLQTSIDIFRQ